MPETEEKNLNVRISAAVIVAAKVAATRQGIELRHYVERCLSRPEPVKAPNDQSPKKRRKRTRGSA